MAKKYGQHMLTEVSVIDNIINRTDIRPTDVVLEIGPGSGNLTRRLLEKAKKVIAIEIDHRMVDELKKTFNDSEYKDKIEIIHADVIKMKLPQFDI
jgi:18S rRNA (adenine1779-N6/adenine1780-N6)-dimethyltransferase